MQLLGSKHFEYGLTLSQNDSTRAKTLELHIQARVAEELKRLQDREEATLKSLLEAESKNSEAPTDAESTAGDTLRTLGREAVSRDVAKLREKLEKRRKVKEIGELDAAVEGARSEIIKCLRDNDRRPLDCYKEVEAFKEGVRKLESAWVERVVR